MSYHLSWIIALQFYCRLWPKAIKIYKTFDVMIPNRWWTIGSFDWPWLEHVQFVLAEVCHAQLDRFVLLQFTKCNYVLSVASQLKLLLFLGWSHCGVDWGFVWHNKCLMLIYGNGQSNCADDCTIGLPVNDQNCFISVNDLISLLNGTCSVTQHGLRLWQGSI